MQYSNAASLFLSSSHQSYQPLKFFQENSTTYAFHRLPAHSRRIRPSPECCRHGRLRPFKPFCQALIRLLCFPSKSCLNASEIHHQKDSFFNCLRRLPACCQQRICSVRIILHCRCLPDHIRSTDQLPECYSVIIIARRNLTGSHPMPSKYISTHAWAFNPVTATLPSSLF